MIRIALAIYALIFLLFGLRSFVDPQSIVSMLGADTVSADGLYELRGIYGGVSIGAGLLCALGAWRDTWQRPALYFLLAYTGGYVIARVAALPLDGMPSGMFMAFAAFEAVTALIAAMLLRRLAGSHS